MPRRPGVSALPAGTSVSGGPVSNAGRRHLRNTVNSQTQRLDPPDGSLPFFSKLKPRSTFPLISPLRLVEPQHRSKTTPSKSPHLRLLRQPAGPRSDHNQSCSKSMLPMLKDDFNRDRLSGFSAHPPLLQTAQIGFPTRKGAAAIGLWATLPRHPARSTQVRGLSIRSLDPVSVDEVDIVIIPDVLDAIACIFHSLLI